MRISSLLAASLAVAAASAVTGPGERFANILERVNRPKAEAKPRQHIPRSATTSKFLNNKTAPYEVDGQNFPGVPFDIGESYAGRLPISSNMSDPSELFFWFFPSTNPAADKEITIWLTGGPGCSSMVALLQENGPFLWQPGVYEPFANPYSWTNLTNMVWVDQPVGVGLSHGITNVKDDFAAADQFIAFWKNFITLFSMEGYKIYITGESYAGMWVPYTAAAMLEAGEPDYYNVKGISIMDPTIGDFSLQSDISVMPFIDHWNNMLNLNDTFVSELRAQADECGYTDYYNKYSSQYPPSGPFPDVPHGRHCQLWNDAYIAALFVNPCFNVYHISDGCPFVWNQVDLYNYAAGPNDYFNQTDVQLALHVHPHKDYTACVSPPGLLYDDNAPPSAFNTLPYVIEKTNNAIVGGGVRDFLIQSNGTKMIIQNMTWNGAQGFQTAPTTIPNFYVPYHNDLAQFIYESEVPGIPFTNTAGGGLAGIWHTERGLTWVDILQAGHETPQYTPGASYRQLEFLLGRIANLSVVGDYTTQTGNFTGTTSL